MGLSLLINFAAFISILRTLIKMNNSLKDFRLNKKQDQSQQRWENNKLWNQFKTLFNNNTFIKKLLIFKNIFILNHWLLGHTCTSKCSWEWALYGLWKSFPDSYTQIQLIELLGKKWISSMFGTKFSTNYFQYS